VFCTAIQFEGNIVKVGVEWRVVYKNVWFSIENWPYLRNGKRGPRSHICETTGPVLTSCVFVLVY